MYFKGKEGCPAGGLLCKSKTDFHKAKQVHSVCRGRRLCRLAGSSGFFRKPKANPYALPNTFVGAGGPPPPPARPRPPGYSTHGARYCPPPARRGAPPAPYSQSGRRVRIRRKTPASGCIPCGRTESSAPTGKLEALYHKTQMFYRIISSSASGVTSSVMPKRSMA